MGFYSPATIVEDAKRHGVPVLPIDVARSGWDCGLEAVGGSRFLGVRMGLRYVKGLGEAEGRRVAAEARRAAFSDLADFARRARLDQRRLTVLAECGALQGLSASRRGALWDVWKLAREPYHALPLPASTAEAAPRFPELDPFETVGWDYRASHHSARGHPLESLRPALRRQRISAAASLAGARDKSTARAAGLVICRQRPGTAKGVVFMTLEDETGFVNVVLWQDVFDEHRALAKTEPFLAVSGRIQRQDGVVHLVAKKLWVPEVGPAPAPTRSHDWG